MVAEITAPGPVFAARVTRLFVVAPVRISIEPFAADIPATVTAEAESVI